MREVCCVLVIAPREHVGPFFVLKKNGVGQRIIVDARWANRHFKTPPHVDLCTSEGISRIEFELPANVDVNSQDGEKYLQNVCCSLGFLDVRD